MRTKQTDKPKDGNEEEVFVTSDKGQITRRATHTLTHAGRELLTDV
jgi:hypothetical protein